jgi:hypothetical protein
MRDLGLKGRNATGEKIWTKDFCSKSNPYMYENTADNGDDGSQDLINYNFLFINILIKTIT